MKGCTSICKSEKEFDVSQIQNKPSRPLEIELCEINKTELHSLVSVVNGNGTTFNRYTFKIGMPKKIRSYCSLLVRSLHRLRISKCLYLRVQTERKAQPYFPAIYAHCSSGERIKLVDLCMNTICPQRNENHSHSYSLANFLFSIKHSEHNKRN